VCIADHLQFVNALIKLLSVFGTIVIMGVESCCLRLLGCGSPITSNTDTRDMVRENAG